MAKNANAPTASQPALILLVTPVMAQFKNVPDQLNRQKKSKKPKKEEKMKTGRKRRKNILDSQTMNRILKALEEAKLTTEQKIEVAKALFKQFDGRTTKAAELVLNVYYVRRNRDLVSD